MLGRLIKVTPSSKVVGDLAIHLAGAGVTVAAFSARPENYDLPESVIGFLHGELGTPPAGWPEPFRSRALQARPTPPAPAELSAVDDAELAHPGPHRQATLNRLLFPGPAREFNEHVARFDDTSSLTAEHLFYGLQPEEEIAVELGRGVEVLLSIEATSNTDEHGNRQVVGRVNGQLRPLTVRDKSSVVSESQAENADRGRPGHVPAPFAGAIIVSVKAGDVVVAGDVVATVEAMKMEAAVTAPMGGVVDWIVAHTAEVAQGDLLLVISE